MENEEGLSSVETTKKPSLNSVVTQRERRRCIEAASQEEADTYTETEERILDEAGAMSLIGHLEELRKRIIISVICIVIGFAISYYYVDTILNYLIAPAGKLYYMKPTEAFFTYMKVAMVSGCLLASPVILHQLWSFIRPALTAREKNITHWILPFAILLFFGGVAFAFFFVLPAAVRFFVGFATAELQPLLSIGQYIDFVIALILPFGFIFELPIVVIILSHLGLIDSQKMKVKRKYFVFIAFVIGALISPTPDVISQTLIAMPMIVLYQASIWILKIQERGKKATTD